MRGTASVRPSMAIAAATASTAMAFCTRGTTQNSTSDLAGYAEDHNRGWLPHDYGRTGASLQYGYIWCDDLVEGEVAHSCAHGPGPHRIKVVVVKKDNDPKLIKLSSRSRGRGDPARMLASASQVLGRRSVTRDERPRRCGLAQEVRVNMPALLAPCGRRS